MADIFHIFNKKQSQEKEVKDLYLRFTVGNPTEATATLNLTADIILTASETGEARNDDTLTTEVEAAAANPTDTVLVDFTGDEDDIIVTVTPNNGTNNTANPDAAATGVLDLTADITLTSVAAGTGRNTNTFTTQVLAAAANPTDTVLADFTGTAAAIVCTITPNDGTNNTANPDAAATATLNLTADITLTSVAAGTGRNTNTFTTEVLAAAANPTDTVLVDFTGTAAAIVCTVTPNDGTNNGATPVDLTTAELVELINTGAVAGKTITLTDASSLRNDQTATGGDATVLVEAGEGDGVVGTFSGGTNDAVDLTTAELVELINTGAVAGKTVTVTDASSLRNDQTAAGGDATALADAGEGDGVVATFTGGTNDTVDLTTAELVELINSGTVAGKTVTLTDASSLRELQTATGGDTTALADAGEGDGVVGTFSGGDGNMTSMDSGYSVGFASVTRTDTGEYTITLQDNYPSLKSLRGTILSSTAQDGRVQIKSQSVSTGSFVIFTLTGATPTDLADGTQIILQMDLKNTAQPW